MAENFEQVSPRDKAEQLAYSEEVLTELAKVSDEKIEEAFNWLKEKGVEPDGVGFAWDKTHGFGNAAVALAVYGTTKDGGVMVSELTEYEKPKSTEIKDGGTWDNLADAFGGYSQVPDSVIGMALIGQVNNNGMEFTKEKLDEIVGKICERWEDQDPNPEEVRSEIIKGMKEQAKDWPRESNEHVWKTIDSLEGK